MNRSFNLDYTVQIIVTPGHNIISFQISGFIFIDWIEDDDDVGWW